MFGSMGTKEFKRHARERWQHWEYFIRRARERQVWGRNMIVLQHFVTNQVLQNVGETTVVLVKIVSVSEK